MIYINATLTIKSGSRDLLLQAAEPCILATREEPGCIRYDLTANVLDENQLVFVEIWKTRADIDLHFERPHMKTWREAALPHIVSRKVEIIHPEHVEVL